MYPSGTRSVADGASSFPTADLDLPDGATGADAAAAIGPGSPGRR